MIKEHIESLPLTHVTNTGIPWHRSSLCWGVRLAGGWEAGRSSRASDAADSDRLTPAPLLALAPPPPLLLLLLLLAPSNTSSLRFPAQRSSVKRSAVCESSGKHVCHLLTLWYREGSTQEAFCSVAKQFKAVTIGPSKIAPVSCLSVSSPLTMVAPTTSSARSSTDVTPDSAYSAAWRPKNDSLLHAP